MMNHHEPAYRRILYAFGGAVFILVGGGFGLSLLLGGLSPVRGEAVFSVLFAAWLIYCALWLFATIRRRRLTLTKDTLTWRTAFATRAMARKDIAAIRIAYAGGVPNIFVYVRGHRFHSMRIPLVFEDNESVAQWFRGL